MYLIPEEALGSRSRLCLQALVQRVPMQMATAWLSSASAEVMQEKYCGAAKLAQTYMGHLKCNCLSVVNLNSDKGSSLCKKTHFSLEE